MRSRSLLSTLKARDLRRLIASPGYDVQVTRPQEQCLVCGSERVQGKELQYPPKPKLTCQVSHCKACGFVAVLRGETGKYRKMTRFDELPTSARAGADERPGREFHMAVMAMDVLGGPSRDVLLYGVGSSQDNRHLEKLDRAGTVAVGDIMKVRDDENFVDVSEPAQQRFDVVVASEVVEHFRNPRADFSHLFEYAKPDGLVVCGTTVNNGKGPLRRHRYIYYPDHTSYYTPEAIGIIAHAEGWLFDFRPIGPGPKRYVLFSKSRAVMERVAYYFGRRVMAPREDLSTD